MDVSEILTDLKHNNCFKRQYYIDTIEYSPSGAILQHLFVCVECNKVVSIKSRNGANWNCKDFKQWVHFKNDITEYEFEIL